MASKALEDAVEAYLRANWTGSPILTENQEGEAPSDGSAFLKLQFPVSDTERMPISNRLYRERGGFRIVIGVPIGQGTKIIREWGETLATLFRDRKFSGIRTQVPSEPYTDDQSGDGNYFVGAMVVPFTAYFTG